MDCTCYIVDRDFDDAAPLPIGRPWRGARVLLLKEDNTPAAPGEEGEICVLGSGVALGYWNAPEQTAKAFVPNPLNPAYPEIMYRVADAAAEIPDNYDLDGIHFDPHPYPTEDPALYSAPHHAYAHSA